MPSNTRACTNKVGEAAGREGGEGGVERRKEEGTEESRMEGGLVSVQSSDTVQQSTAASSRCRSSRCSS